MVDRNIKDFWEYTAEDISNSAPAPTKGSVAYHVKVREAEVNEWEDGRTRLDISTEVASGEHSGKFGPRITWSEPRDYEGVTKDGREWSTTEEAETAKIAVQLKAIMDGQTFPIQQPIREESFKAIGRRVVGREFIVNVKEDDNGYLRVTRVFAMSDPPKTFKGSAAASTFSLEDV